MLHKTNAARILDTLQIDYQLKEFKVEPEDLSAAHAAELACIMPGTIYKTIVLRGKVNPFIVVVLPSEAHINLKKAAKEAGDKNCELIHVKELQQITGYIRGGCSPVGMKKQFPTFVDISASEKEGIFVSAGKRGVLMWLAPTDLLRACNGRYATLI